MLPTAAGQRSRRKREPKPTAEKDTAHDCVNAMFGDMEPETLLTLVTGEDESDMLSFVTAQMSAKAGIKQFGDKGTEAIMKEMEQLLHRKVMEGRKANTLTKQQKKAALKCLMFLKEKRCGKIKGRGCADGRKQRPRKTKEETSAPTIMTEALFLTCIIDAMEDRCVVTCGIPGAFVQVDMDELVHLKLEGELAEILIRIDPSSPTACDLGER